MHVRVRVRIPMGFHTFFGPQLVFSCNVYWCCCWGRQASRTRRERSHHVVLPCEEHGRLLQLGAHELRREPAPPQPTAGQPLDVAHSWFAPPHFHPSGHYELVVVFYKFRYLVA